MPTLFISVNITPTQKNHTVKVDGPPWMVVAVAQAMAQYISEAAEGEDNLEAIIKQRVEAEGHRIDMDLAMEQ